MHKLKLLYTIKTILILFIPIAFVIIRFSQLVVQLQLQKEKERITEVTKVQVGALRNALDNELTRIQDDLDYLTEHQALLKYFQFTNKKRFDELETYWLDFAKKRKYYDQLRYIDINGMEKLRINHGQNGIISVSQPELQNKSAKNYVLKTAKLSKGETYISPFELNIQNGQVEIPFKPVMRFVRTVYDQNNHKQGIVVLNFLGKHLLDKVGIYEKVTQGQLLLLNSGGYYLRGLTPANEWGFMFPRRAKLKTFSRAYPSAWAEINKKQSGQFSNMFGLFTFEKLLFPSNALVKKHKFYRQWMLINVIHSSELEGKISSFYQLTWNVTLGMLVGLAIIIIFFARVRTQKKQTQLALYESEQRSSLILESVAEGIYGVDSDGIITFINPAACKLLGYSPEQLVGRKPYGLFYHIQSDTCSHSNKQCLAMLAMREAKTQYSSEISFETKDGQIIPVEYTAAPIQCNGLFEEAVITFRDISERKASEMELTKIATTDALTGSFNRHKFAQLIEQEIINSNSLKRGFSIAILDIDFFKLVNDTYGHDVGDTTLVNLALILMSNLRSSDALIRWGGEEFVVICPDTTEEGVYQLAEKLRHVVARTEFETIGNLTISIGIGEYNKLESQERFFTRIDQALYEAKKSGRNCVKRAITVTEAEAITQL